MLTVLLSRVAWAVVPCWEPAIPLDNAVGESKTSHYQGTKRLKVMINDRCDCGDDVHTKLYAFSLYSVFKYYLIFNSV